MPRKKTDEETVENGAEATEETATTEENSEAVETQEAGDAETAETENTEATEEEPKKSKQAASEGETQETSILDAVIGTVASAVETVASTVTNFVAGSDDNKTETAHGKRSERIGTVTSDKMTKTVVVRVDRLVKHPKYRKYVRRRKQFMAHDELGATIGDKVRIIETRPLSARKRWRVVEIVQKAAK
jgi:small subunit ribosomal protein S17